MLVSVFIYIYSRFPGILSEYQKKSKKIVVGRPGAKNRLLPSNMRSRHEHTLVPALLKNEVDDIRYTYVRANGRLAYL